MISTHKLADPLSTECKGCGINSYSPSLFLETVSYSPVWLRIHSVAKDDLNPLITLPLPCQGKHCTSYLIVTVTLLRA